MQVDRLRVRNFSGFESQEFTFDPHFTLLIGDNATGKSSVLDALSIALGSWFLGIRGYARAVGIEADEVRVVAHKYQDSYSFDKQFPSRIEASGVAMGVPLTWARELGREGGRTTSIEAKSLSDIAEGAEKKVRAGEEVTLPLICTYGTERLWFESSHRTVARANGNRKGLPSRLDGYRDCINFSIEESSLVKWIRAQVSVGHQRKNETIAFQVFREATTNCVEGARNVYYDDRYNDLVVEFEGHGQQLFNNLSDGQRMMLTLAGDLARRATTLNPHLGAGVLKQTPGVVIVDELDLHLHPKWQRRVIHDLRRTFPRLQFIATTHSPQLIGEVPPAELRLLSEGGVVTPEHSFGVDSSRILEELMDAAPRNGSVEKRLKELFSLIDQEDFVNAHQLCLRLENEIGSSDPEITRARALMAFLETPA
jgi:predicted ATP-binding protein involved in virulence